MKLRYLQILKMLSDIILLIFSSFIGPFPVVHPSLNSGINPPKFTCHWWLSSRFFKAISDIYFLGSKKLFSGFFVFDDLSQKQVIRNFFKTIGACTEVLFLFIYSSRETIPLIVGGG